MDVNLLFEILSKSWTRDTCVSSLKNDWNKQNSSLGQCAISALIINDFYGGKIMRCMTSSGSHYYNVVDNELIDFTASQFGDEIPLYEYGEERSRNYLLSNDDTRKRYYMLLSNVKHNLLQYSTRTYRLILEKNK